MELSLNVFLQVSGNMQHVMWAVDAFGRFFAMDLQVKDKTFFSCRVPSLRGTLKTDIFHMENIQAGITRSNRISCCVYFSTGDTLLNLGTLLLPKTIKVSLLNVQW